jgi:hypothetical protein
MTYELAETRQYYNIVPERQKRRLQAGVAKPSCERAYLSRLARPVDSGKAHDLQSVCLDQNAQNCKVA